LWQGHNREQAGDMIDKPGQISDESGQGGVARPKPSEFGDGVARVAPAGAGENPAVERRSSTLRAAPEFPLTPAELIRLGIASGHEPDVILASLEAAGWVVVPLKATPEIAEAGSDFIYEAWGDGKTIAAECYRAMLSARPK
jgi:hypothetical protein